MSFLPVKHFLRSAADALDILSLLCSAGAVIFVLNAFGTLDTGPAFMQIATFGIMLAVIPYCLAGALHRIVVRFDL